MEPARARAFVIEVRDYGEADKIVTFFSDSRGRFSGIAKGAKKSFKRFLNKLELFTLLDVLFTDSRSSTLVMIDQAELIDPFPALRENYHLYTTAALVAELTLHWTRENDPDPDLFRLLTWTFLKLAKKSTAPATIAILFQLRLFSLSGFHPDFHACGRCGRLSPALTPFRFSSSYNGLICGDCSRGGIAVGPADLVVSISTIRLLQKAQELDNEKLGRLRFSNASIEESVRILRSYGSHILQRDILAWDFLLEGNSNGCI
ncbi:MAG: DNA repair protein RecO [Proteobacteria bacterium]|nr:DNA repair protein RecO [Pseudomonadota bacterium]MBU1738631.1 DNA repair protein RecO [Pseudomonadota bacterium]